MDVPRHEGSALPLTSMRYQLNGSPACRLLLQILPSARWLTSGLKLHGAVVLEQVVKARQQVSQLLWVVWR